MSTTISENELLARWLLSWVEDAGAETPLDLVHRLWRIDHYDSGLPMLQKNKAAGAKYLKDFKGAKMGRTAGVSVLRGVRPSDDTEQLAAIHALVTGRVVLLGESVRAWDESVTTALPVSPVG